MMITLVSGNIELEQLKLTPWEQGVLQMKQKSPVDYTYSSAEALTFEMRTRTAIVEAAKGLYRSGASFAEFNRSRCNRRFWIRTSQGGFQLRGDVLPSDGINDIFRNGRLYAFECATAIVLVMYKGILDAVGPDTFNTYFRDLLLFTWYFDNDLKFIRVQLPEVYPGDALYFNNPDFIPYKPGWRGENVIMMDTNLFFGHGPGILPAETILAILNSKRIPGSMTPAYVLKDALTLDFEHIRKLKEGAARIGRIKYLFA
jgi:protein-glutamine gamma-glutamyltransferase